jgi:hypothetical protein
VPGGGGGLMSPPRLVGQHQAGRLHRFVLDMEQVGRMMGAEVLFRVSDQGFGLIAGDLANRYRPTGQPLVESLAPGFSIALGRVLFQQQEIGNRFDTHQADLRMKGYCRKIRLDSL